MLTPIIWCCGLPAATVVIPRFLVRSPSALWLTLETLRGLLSFRLRRKFHCRYPRSNIADVGHYWRFETYYKSWRSAVLNNYIFMPAFSFIQLRRNQLFSAIVPVCSFSHLPPGILHLPTCSETHIHSMLYNSVSRVTFCKYQRKMWTLYCVFILW